MKQGNIVQKTSENVEKSVQAVLDRLQVRKKNTNAQEGYVFLMLEKRLQEVIAEKFSKDVQIKLQVAPVHTGADFAIETFSLAKNLGMQPVQVAQEIIQVLNDKVEYVKEAVQAGPFVNLFLNSDVYNLVLKQVESFGKEYGSNQENIGKVAVFDYSAPNIAKPIGVGHMRSTIIGQALSNLYEKAGYSVVRDNHLGDWGTQFGKLVYAYQQWGDEEKIVKNPIRELKDLYVRFNSEAENNPELKEEARKIFQKMESGDEDLLSIWKRFLDLSEKDFEKTYKRLGVSFDTSIGESYFRDTAKEAVEECLSKGVCKKDPETGAVIAEDLDGLPTFLLQKQDGSTLYITRDLATLRFRVKTFNPDVLLYVVGGEQELNFKQLFALSKKLGYLPERVQAKHIGFGMILVDGKKMSTRRGTLVELDELLQMSVEKSRAILHEKNPELTNDELDVISEIVGIGAIIYNDLRQSRVKNISFDWEHMLDLEGGSAPYLQYTVVRINSIIRKVAQELGAPEAVEKYEFEKESEFALAKKLMLYPGVIAKAQETDSPHDVCVYLEELALQFNSFYNDVSIMKTEDVSLRNSRLQLIQAVAQVIADGLSLLSIKVPEKM